MAKTAHCAFCGKEITTGFFKGNAQEIHLGGKYTLHCCEECYAVYGGADIENRLKIKLGNVSYRNKQNYTVQDLAAIVTQYVGEKAASDCRYPERATTFEGFACFSPQGHFTVREYALGFTDSDVRAKQMVKSLEKANDTQCGLFDKNDISCIEYRSAGMGDSLGLFTKAYSYEIRLNDQKTFTYKPCITRTAVLGRGLFMRRSAEKKVVAELEAFKAHIGSELPIVKVKNFK